MIGQDIHTDKRLAELVRKQSTEKRTSCDCPDCGASLNIVTNEKCGEPPRLDFVKHN